MSIGYILFAGVFAGGGAAIFSFGLSEHLLFANFVGVVFFLPGFWLLISGLRKTSVFSLNGVFFLRGFRSIPRFRIAALQHLGKGIRQNREMEEEPEDIYAENELNLVLDDTSRINLFHHGDKEKMTEDALILARMLNCPIWTADGKIIQTPEQMADCAEKMKKSRAKKAKGLVRALERKPIPGLIFGIVIFGVILFASYLALGESMRLMMRSRSWVECPATVTRSTIKKRWESLNQSNTPH